MTERSESQKAADKRYAIKIKGRYKKFSTDLPSEEADSISELIKEKGLSKAAFIRKAAEKLKNDNL